MNCEQFADQPLRALTLAGLVVVHELLDPLQLAAIACVVAASVGATRSASTFEEPGPA